MNDIELSIIIPVYNVELYLRKCLDTIYPLQMKKEVILIDDGSQDNSFGIMQEYKDKFPEETIIISQENKGVSAVRNRGLEVALGKYVAFLDSDDFIDTIKYEEFFKRLKQEEVDILHGNGFYYQIDEKKEKIFETEDSIFIDTTLLGKEFYEKGYNLQIHRDYVWLNIYRREYLLENSLFFREGITYEDKIFSQEAFWKAEKIRYVPMFFYYYRQNSESITRKPRNVLDYFYVHNCLLDFALQEKISNLFVTKEIISIVRSLSKKEKVFNEEIYKKLWKLPKKNFLAYRNLLDMYFRKKKLKKINYEDILMKGHKKEG